MRRVYIALGTAAVVAGVTAAAPKLGPVADKVNLLGMLGKISSSTSGIDKVNSNTVGELGTIIEQASKAASVGQKLDVMKNLLNVQVNRLDSLKQTTQKQVSLSSSLKQQSEQLQSLLNSIGNTSNGLNSSMAGLSSTSKAMADGMGSIVSANQTVQSKLQKVAQLASEVNQELP